MKRLLLAMLLLLPLSVSHAQAVQQCLCTAGCKVVSTYYVNDASAPTGCTIYKAGVSIATGAIVQSSGIASSNAGVCQPADVAYVPGPAGSLACIATIPAQTNLSSVALTVRGVNSAGEAPDGAVFTFQSVSQLATVPATKTLRVTP